MAPASDRTESFVYNGVSLGVYRSEISAKPEYDEAGRTITCVAYTITITGYLLPGDGFVDAGETTDATMADYRKRLGKPGGKLRYLNKGFGDLVVNEGGVWDVEWGPKPELLSFVPIGNDQAAFVTIRITTKIPDCKDAKYQYDIMEFNYDEQYSIDQNGDQQITIKGHLKIPMTRAGITDRRLTDHVDRYREKLQFEPPLGFQRISQDYSVSSDKRKLTFSIVDKQIPVPMPPGVSAIDASHSVSSKLMGGTGFVRWQNNVKASITLPAGIPRERSLAIFLYIVGQKIAASGASIPGVSSVTEMIRGPILVAAGLRIRKTVLLDSFSIQESIFGRTHEFSLSYILIVTVPFDKVVKYTGLWKNLGYKRIDYHNGAKEYNHHIRGTARIAGGKGTIKDVIIDLCDRKEPEKSRLDETLNNTEIILQRRFASPVGRAGGGVRGAGSSRTPREDSWISWNCEVIYEETTGRLARHSPMGGTIQKIITPAIDNQIQQSFGRSAFANQISYYDGGTILGSAVNTQAPSILQEVREPDARVILQGWAIRLGYQIPIPSLVSVGGQTAHLNRIVRTMGKVLAIHEGEPLFLQAWMVEYLLEGPPSQSYVLPANPVLRHGAIG